MEMNSTNVLASFYFGNTQQFNSSTAEILLLASSFKSPPPPLSLMFINKLIDGR